jgi:hypothetical protein
MRHFLKKQQQRSNVTLYIPAILTLLCFLFLFSCLEEDHRDHQTITVESIDFTSATISWTPTPTDLVYHIYLGDSLVTDRLHTPSFTFRNLALDSEFVGKVVTYRKDGSAEGSVMFSTHVEHTPAEDLDMPKRVLHVTRHIEQGFPERLDSIQYDYLYDDDGRISLINLSYNCERCWVNSVAFVYSPRTVEVLLLTDFGVAKQSLVFEFNNDHYLFPTTVTRYDDWNWPTDSTQRSLQYVGGFIDGFNGVPFYEDSGNIKMNGTEANSTPNAQIQIHYTDTTSRLNQFCGFFDFTLPKDGVARPLPLVGIDPILWAVPWFKPSKNLARSIPDFHDKRSAQYEYAFEGGRVKSIECLYQNTWSRYEMHATIEY